MNRKILGISTVLLTMLGALGIASAHAAPLRTEVYVKNVFVAPEGYDDNDEVELVVSGYLPNICYEVKGATFEAMGKTKVIRVRQYALQKDIPGCGRGQAELEDHLKWPVRYVTQLPIGSLPRGSYEIEYEVSESKFDRVKFVVGPAKSASVDEELYAPISSAFIPEVLEDPDDVHAVLTGVIETNCMSFKDVQVLKYEHVIVVLPKAEVNKEVECTKSELPIRKIISLGKLPLGDYLLHVRSLAGRSVNRVFKVIKPSGRRSVRER